MMQRAMLAMTMVLSLTAMAMADNFRMETDVFEGSDKKPFCQTLTLFTETMIYDFMYGAGGTKDDQVTEITVFDMSSGRVILLDMARGQKTVLTHEQLIRMTTEMKVHTTEQDAVYHFAANPKFTVKFAEDKGELRLTSANMNYYATTQAPQQSEAPERYREFAEWSARLNACRPGNLPPFARMELGQELAARNVLPAEIIRSTVAPTRLGNKKLELRSRHLINWTISNSDRKRIEGVAEQIGKFEAITFISYVQPAKK